MIKERNKQTQQIMKMFLLGAIFHTPATEIRDTGNRILILARGDEADKSMASWGCEQLMVMLPFRQSVWLAVWDETNFL